MNRKAARYPTVNARLRTLSERRNLKMAASAHAYVRGSTVQFYRWLTAAGARSVPQGPPVWICGDCHVGNLGPLADSAGDIHVQIRDLERVERRAIDDLFKEATIHHLVTSLKARQSDARIEVLDAAYWMKGCSSLGRLRFAVLLNVSNGKRKDDEFCLIDIQEASPPAAPRAMRAKMPADNAIRVVEGAKHLSPALGERVMPAKLLEHSVFLRELMPQDLKLEIDQLTRDEAVSAARYLAAVVGKAHARQLDAPTRREFRRSLTRRYSKRLDAPSWLWSSVVQLAAAHEAAYLEHCRLYALS